jgi:hypothetical protein
MSVIYVACGGTTDINGIYDPIVGGYENRNNSNYTLTVDGNYWELIDNSYSGGILLYNLYQSTITDPIDTLNWNIVNGVSPTIKTYNFVSSDTATFNTFIVTGAGTSAINGTYTWTTNVTVAYNTGGGQSVDGYLHSGGTYIIVPISGTWEIRDVTNYDLYYESSLTSSEPPIGSFTLLFGGGSNPPPDISHDTTTICTNNMTNGQFFINYRNNQAYIRYNNQTPYIRTQ